MYTLYQQNTDKYRTFSNLNKNKLLFMIGFSH